VINEADIRLSSNASLRIHSALSQNLGEIWITNDSHLMVEDLRLLVEGELELSDDSSLRFDIVSLTTRRGVEVEGNAHLGGSIEFTVTNDTTPILGRSWYVLRAASATGAFDSVSFDEIEDPTLRFMLRETATSSSFALDLLVRHIADPNGDMVVDMQDLNLVLHDYGQAGALLAGDADTNGIVDFRDLNLVLANFGQTFRAAVPAPGAFAAFCLMAGGGLVRRRR
jgi:hypothetical protein